jgi:hypothetical protein
LLPGDGELARLQLRENLMLMIPLQKLAYIITKAREFGVEVPPVDEDSGSNPSDDAEWDVLEAGPDNPSYQELVDAINSLNEPERIELLALTWLERGDYIKEEWRAALEKARRINDEKETDFFSLRASVGAQRTTRTSQASGWTLRGPACSGARPTESLRAIGAPPERGQSHGLPARARRRQCGATMQDGARPPSSTPKNVARALLSAKMPCRRSVLCSTRRGSMPQPL